MSLIVEGDGAAGDGAEVEEGFGEVGLAVAVDAGDAEDLVGVEGRGEVVDGGGGRVWSRTLRFWTRRMGGPGGERGFGGGEVDVAADHEAGESRGRWFPALAKRGEDAAVAHDRDAVGERRGSRGACG